MIPFNKPYITGKETAYIQNAVYIHEKISGNGYYTQLCHNWFEEAFGFNKCLLTTSCTDALEMAAILSDIKPGDEVIVPSFTFVSSALAFIRQGAKIVFADSYPNHPNMDAEQLESLITPRTKAMVPVHYAGIACDMDKIMQLSAKYNLYVVEDAAQAIESYYKGKPLGSLGDFGCFSFHETKNIQCGEGGMISINRQELAKRAEIIWEKGTNRAEFFRGEVDKYGWVDIGSSFLPSEINAAFLFAQIEGIKQIQEKRKMLWETYDSLLRPMENKGVFFLPEIPTYSTNNAHMYFLVCNSLADRIHLIKKLKSKDIMAVFRYQSLHKSLYFNDKHDGRHLPNCDRFSDCLIRLPLYYNLSINEVERICEEINKAF